MSVRDDSLGETFRRRNVIVIVIVSEVNIDELNASKEYNFKY